MIVMEMLQIVTLIIIQLMILLFLIAWANLYIMIFGVIKYINWWVKIKKYQFIIVIIAFNLN